MLNSSSIACLSASLGDTCKGLFSTANMYSPNSRCRPSSCLLAALAMFLANSSPNVFLPREKSEMFHHVVLTTQLRPQVFLVNCAIISQFCCTIDVIFHISKDLPNLVDRSWL